jgi:glycosyltransferase involved in cell wall biosynthesis
MRLSCWHEVHVITIAGPDPRELAAVASLAATGIQVHVAWRTEPEGLDRWRRRRRFAWQWIGRGWPFRTVWFWDSSLQHLLNMVVAAHDPHLILVEDNAVGMYRYPSVIPTVFTEHEVRRPRRARWPGGIGRGLMLGALRERDWHHWAGYQTAVWRRFLHIQVFTPRDRAVMSALAPELSDRIAVNPFGVRVPAAPLDGDEANTIVFAANFSHHPNVDAALWLTREIMPMLRRSTPGVRLTLVGSAPPPHVRALACDDIAVTGWVQEIEPYLQRAAVVLAPVRVGGGMRAKVVLGMALGKPVVSTSRGVEGVAIGGEPLPVRIADEAPAIAEVIASLLASPQERRALGRSAHAFAAHHLSVDAYLRRLEERLGPLLPEGLCR